MTEELFVRGDKEKWENKYLSNRVTSSTGYAARFCQLICKSASLQ